VDHELVSARGDAEGGHDDAGQSSLSSTLEPAAIAFKKKIF